MRRRALRHLAASSMHAGRQPSFPAHTDAMRFAQPYVDATGGATNPYLMQFGEEGDGTNWNGVAPYQPPHRALDADVALDDPEAILIAWEAAFAALGEVADAFVALCGSPDTK